MTSVPSSSIEFGLTTCLCLSSIVLTTSLTLMPLISENCFTGIGGVTSNDRGAASAISGAFDDERLRWRSWKVCLPWRSPPRSGSPPRERLSRRAPGRDRDFGEGRVEAAASAGWRAARGAAR